MVSVPKTAVKLAPPVMALVMRRFSVPKIAQISGAPSMLPWPVNLGRFRL
jgi:hypothetical protein